MRKILIFMLALALLLGSTLPVFAYSDVVWSRDTTLGGFINHCNVGIVRTGVTLSFKEYRPDPQGLEVHKSLTVEQGGTITGPGIIIFDRGTVCSGLDLYYTAAGEEKLLDVGMEELFEVEPAPDFRAHFSWNAETRHYVLIADYANDPFHQDAVPDQGDQTVGDAYTALDYAEALRALGLFKGTGTAQDGSIIFSLDRAPTRAEAVVMLIRLLGQEETAVSYPAEKCPFTDAPDWARSYLAFAFDNGLTKGTSATTFGNGDATPQQFLTFVLRSMGYSDAADGDFTWDRPEPLADGVHIYPGAQEMEDFTRGTAVRIMYDALNNQMKDGALLKDKLIKAGVFSLETWDAAAVLH